MRVFARAYVCGPGQDPEEAKRTAGRSGKGAFVQTASAGSADNEAIDEMLSAQTLQAEESGSLLARSPQMDFLLRLAGTTQISRAIREEGAVAGEPFLLVTAGRRRPGAVRRAKWKELPRRPLTGPELDRVEEAALLNARRATSRASAS